MAPKDCQQLRAVAEDKVRGENDPYTIGNEKEEDVVGPGKVSGEVSSLAEVKVLDHVDQGLPKGCCANEEATE